MSISSTPRVKRIKYKAEEALAKEALITESINIPGKTKEMYETPETSLICEPITVPKINIYKDAEITGAPRVCIFTFIVRLNSRRSNVYRPM